MFLHIASCDVRKSHYDLYRVMLVSGDDGIFSKLRRILNVSCKAYRFFDFHLGLMIEPRLNSDTLFASLKLEIPVAVGTENESNCI